MVYGEVLAGAIASRVGSADSTDATLELQDRVVFFLCDVVGSEKVRTS